MDLKQIIARAIFDADMRALSKDFKWEEASKTFQERYLDLALSVVLAFVDNGIKVER